MARSSACASCATCGRRSACASGGPGASLAEEGTVLTAFHARLAVVAAASEKAMIVNALRASNWNQSKAARALGISRDNIRYRIKKYGVIRPE